MEEVGSDGLKRAKWVDCSTNPKKHGEFEGHLKGEPAKIKRYKWTGRQWMFLKPAFGRKKAHWVPSIFGEPGDKWRGLVEDPNLQSVATTTDPETEIKNAVAEKLAENIDAQVVGLDQLYTEEEDKALAKTAAEAQCKCDLRTKLVGDGCDTCNPEKAAEYSQEAQDTDAGVSIAA